MPFARHIAGAADLITTYQDRRAGFIALALEKNVQATPYVAAARALRVRAEQCARPADLLKVKDIRPALLLAAGLSDKALSHLDVNDKTAAIVGLIENHLDLCLFDGGPDDYNLTASSCHKTPATFLALGELKGGIDPARADEHWKTAIAALRRIEAGFADKGFSPARFFIGAAIERSMADEMYQQLQVGHLTNAANLCRADHAVSLCEWLIDL